MPIGALGGELSVDHNGSFRYSIPIEVPPGRHGMAPNLSVQYTSSAGTSSVGLGFSVSGLSSIRRCSKNFHNDARREGITLTPEDALCLDGQRLIADPTSPSGGHGTQYRTERDALLRITSFTGEDGIDGISSFLVEFPTGATKRYGMSAGGRQTVSRDGGSVVVRWLIEEDRDADLNTISYEYDHVLPTKISEVGDRDPIELVHPRRIVYTGYRDGTEVEVGTRAVEFIYLDELNGDALAPYAHASSGYLAGHFYLGQDARRLRAIRTSVDGQRHREYQFDGQVDPQTRRWRLEKIRGCVEAPVESPDFATEDGLVCMPSDVFEWRSLPAVEPHPDDTYGLPTFQQYFIEWPERKKTWTGLCSDGVSTCRERNPVIPLDVNGDGADDLAYFIDDGESRSRVALRFGLHNSRSPAGHLGPGPFRRSSITSIADQLPVHGYKALDFDLDGLDDLAYVALDGQLTVLQSTGEDFIPNTSFLPRFDVEPFETGTGRWKYVDHLNADIDGDGRSDLLACQWDRDAEPLGLFTDSVGPDHIYNRAATWHYALRDGAGYGPLIDSGVVTNCMLEDLDYTNHALAFDYISPNKPVGDFDGDGRAEVLIAPGPDTSGTGFATQTFRLLRWDADADRMVAIDTNVASLTNPSRPTVNALMRPTVIDVNGDGLHDLVGLDESRRQGSVDRMHRRILSLGEPGVFANHEHPSSSYSTEYGPTALGYGPRRIVLTTASSGTEVIRSVLQGLPFDFNGDGRGDLLVRSLADGDTLPVSTGGDVFEWNGSRVDVLEGTNGFDPVHYATDTFIRGERLTGNGQSFYIPELIQLDGDGDGALDLIELVDVATNYAPENPAFRFHHSLRGAPVVMTAVTNGLQSRNEIEYAPLSDASVYTPGRSSCGHPTKCETSSRLVVSEMRFDNGVGGFRRLTFTYEDARTDIRSGRWLGFAVKRSADHTSGARTETRFDNTINNPIYDVYAFAGMPHTHIVRRHTDPGNGEGSLRAIASRTRHSWKVVPGTIPGTYRVNNTATEVTSFRSMVAPPSDEDLLLGLTEMNRETATRTFDEFGNELTSETNYWTDGIGGESVSTYDNDVSSWRLGLLRSHETSAYEGDCTVRAENLVTYWPGTIHPRELTREPGTPHQTITSFEYDRYGNASSKTIRAAGSADRVTKARMDPEGYFIVGLTNALDHEDQLEVSPANGFLTRRVDPNGVETRWSYDGFGRLREETAEGGESYEIRYEFGIVAASRMTIIQEGEGGWALANEVDSLGRTFIERWRAPDNTYEQRTRFDARGYPAAISAPYPTYPVRVPPDAWSTRVVDDLGLVREVVSADGVQSEFWYDLRASYERDADGAIEVIRQDALSRLSSVETLDPATRTSYTYCVDQLRTVDDGLGHVTTVEYDEAGRKTLIVEPDRGATSFEYTPFSELATRIDEAGRKVDFEYDVLGRMVRRIHAADGTESRFEWDTAPLDGGGSALGLLAGTVNDGGTVTDNYAYDEHARLRQHVREVGRELLVASMEYDGFGRLAQMTYPTVDRARTPPQVNYEHGPTGLVDTILMDGDKVWELDRVDRFGRPARATLGHGLTVERSFSPTGRELTHTVSGTIGTDVVEPLGLSYDYDPLGRLNRRRDSATGRIEKYSYDLLGRVTDVESSDAAYRQHYEYDLGGNLTFAHDVGRLSYPTAADARHPHGVEEVGSTRYRYDEVGNVVRRGAMRIDYNQFNLPTSIQDRGGAPVSFGYDVQGARAIRRSGSATSLYFPKIYEVRRDGATTVEVFRVYGPDGEFLQIDRTGTGSAVADDYQYLHTDRMGSVVAVSHPDGSIERFGYDAFGARIDAPTSGSVNTGFTGHEHEDELGLINMRGRMFDARARRFMTPDPLVSEMGVQGLNRYSYVANDPLNLLDPSGYGYFQIGADRPIEQPDGTQLGPTIVLNTDWDSGEEGAGDDAADERSGAAAAGGSSSSGSGASRSMGLALGNPGGERGLLEQVLDPDNDARYLGPGGTTAIMFSNGVAYVAMAGLGVFLAVEVAGVAGIYATGALLSEGAGAVAAVPAAIDSTVAEVGYVIVREAIRRPWLGRMIVGARMIVESLDDGHVPHPHVERIVGGRVVIESIDEALCFAAGTTVAMDDEDRVPIEAVEVGDRVSSRERCDPDPYVDSSWRAGTLVLVDGSDHPTAWTLLRPGHWFEDQGLVEAGVSVSLVEVPNRRRPVLAFLTALVPVPEITPGAGCLVTGSMSGWSKNIRVISVEGTTEQLFTTAEHPLFSVSNSSWVAAGNLRPRDLIDSVDGGRFITRVEAQEEWLPVHNLEVWGAHEYFVGEGELRAHNTCWLPIALRDRGWSAVPQWMSGLNPHGHHIIPKIGWEDARGIVVDELHAMARHFGVDVLDDAVNLTVAPQGPVRGQPGVHSLVSMRRIHAYLEPAQSRADFMRRLELIGDAMSTGAWWN